MVSTIAATALEIAATWSPQEIQACLAEYAAIAADPETSPVELSGVAYMTPILTLAADPCRTMNAELDPNMDYCAYQIAVLLSGCLDIGELQNYSVALANQP